LLFEQCVSLHAPLFLLVSIDHLCLYSSFTLLHLRCMDIFFAEYGLGLRPSTSGDVYSYGVMLLELFTGKSPTHEIFSGGSSIIKWVQSAFPANIEQVVDAELLLSIQDFQHDAQSISPEKQHECLITILGVGLSCTVDSPDRRTNMRDSLLKLKTARDTLLKPPLDHKPDLDLEAGIGNSSMKSF